MARQSSAEKVARFRQRQAGFLSDLPTCSCGKQIRNGRQLCSRCWKRTPEGKAVDAERKRLSRARVLELELELELELRGAVRR